MDEDLPPPAPAIQGHLTFREGLKTLRERLAARPDSEHEQSFIRLVAGAIVALLGLLDPSCTTLSSGEFRALMLAFFAGALLFLLAIAHNPRISVFRRMVGMVFDSGFTTFFLATSREAGTPVAVLYLWMIVGNGFRYGPSYLLGATAMAATGLTVVYRVNPLWTHDPGLYAAFLLAILLHPLYTLSMIRKLRTAVAAAEAANRAKSRFLANVSHELRTPLSGVLGIGELLWKTGPTREQGALLRMLNATALSLKGLIENVLEMSKIDSGRLVIAREPLNLFSLAEEAMRTIAPLAHDKKLALSLRILGVSGGRIIGDGRLLRQVLVNLLGNAVKFTERGQVVLSVSESMEAGGSRRLRFEVEDTGIGIPEELRPRVFMRFAQGEEGVTRKYGGTGLGTSIAKETVEAMGGAIGFSSRPGAGSRFWFEIPLSFVPEDEVPRESQENAPDRPFHILWVDPDGSSPSSGLLPPFMEAVPVRSLSEATAVAGARQATGGFEALVINLSRAGEDQMKEWGRIAASPMLETLPLILFGNTASGTHPDIVGSGSVPRVPVFLSGDPALLRGTLEALKRLEKGRTGQGAHRGVPLSLLLAEDHPVNRKVLSSLLEEAGHSVVAAGSGKEALALFESSPDGAFDLLILDYNMPEMGGLDVLQNCRKMSSRFCPPTVILTAAVTPEVEEACLAEGVEAFLAKPVDPERLLDTIARIAERSVLEPTASVRILDPMVLEKLSHVVKNARFLPDLVDDFRSEGTRLLSEMEEALGERDPDRLRDLAHALKGSALQMGAVRLSRLCSRVSGGSGEDVEDVTALVAKISEAFEESLRHLEKWLEGNRPFPGPGTSRRTE